MGNIRVRLPEAVHDQQLISAGWIDHRHSDMHTYAAFDIGKTPAAALARTRFVDESMKPSGAQVLISDVAVFREGAGGEYRFGDWQFSIRAEVGRTGLLYVSGTGPLREFEQVAKMLEDPEFTTDWFVRRLITTTTRPSLPQLLAARRYRRFRKVA